MKIYTQRANISFVVMLCLWVLCFPDAPAAAQSASPLDGERQSAIDSHITQLMTNYNIPGLALGIVEANQVIYLRGYGVADSSGRTVTPQTPFFLASLSKSFTGVAIMQLVEAGQVELDAPVQRYLPWFQLADAEAAARITIADLLYQRSGLSGYDGQVDIFDGDQSAAALENGVRKLRQAALVHPPGTAFEYTNSNYDILGLVVQTVSEQPYEDYIQQHIYDPLDMKHATSSTHFAEAQADGMSAGFVSFFGRMIERETLFSRHSVASAGLIASADDLTHYIIAQLNDGQYQGEPILSAEDIRQTHIPGSMMDKLGGYAMGWGSRPITEAAKREDGDYRAPLMILHQGGWANFRSVIILVPRERLGIVALMNAANFEQDSAFFHPAYDTALLMLGINPPPVEFDEDLLTQNARFINGVVLILMVGLLLHSLLILRRWRRGERPMGLKRWRAVLLPLVWDAVVVLVYVGIIPQVYQSPFINNLIATPDYGIVVGIIVGIAVVWGAVRTALFMQAWLRRPT
ncbi:MAG: serine hydrolase domain-containing protein [Anaerolineae bacterium]